MSQDLRDYELVRVDNRIADHPREARKLRVTATVGPTTDDMDETRGVQISLEGPNGFMYGRVSESQVRDLIETLQERVDPDGGNEATGWEAERKHIQPDGEEL